MREEGLICPCGSTDVNVCYTQPLQFECGECERELIDENAGPAIPRISEELARLKVPWFYKLPACPKCNHGVHDGNCKETCQVCIPLPPHVYKMRYA